MPSGISFIIPFHNEAATLKELHTRLSEVSGRERYDSEFLFVDDGSDDEGFAIVRELANSDPRVRGFKFQRNFGQTAAISAGIHESTKPVIIMLDADLQNDPDDVPHLLKKLEEGYDVVSGWRKNRREGLTRRLPSTCANAIISWVTGVRLKDYGCSLKVYRREYIEHAPLYGDMHRFIPVIAAWYGARVAEIPVHHEVRKHGQSHYGLFGRTFRVLLDLLTVKFLHTYVGRPMHFFGAVGLTIMGTGVLAGMFAVILKLLKLRDFVATPLPLITAFLITLGVFSLLLGLLAELLIRIYFEQPGHRGYRIHETAGK